MSPYKFTLARLLVVFAIIAVGIVALLHASSAWATAVVSVTVGLLLLGSSRAVVSHGADAAFWVPFSLSGWVYLLLVSSSFLAPTVASSLATTRVIEWLHPRILSQSSFAVGEAISVQWNQGWYPARILESRSNGAYKIHYDGDTDQWDEWVTTTRMRPEQPTWESFCQVGQALWTLIVAVLAGWTGRRYFARAKG